MKGSGRLGSFQTRCEKSAVSFTDTNLADEDLPILDVVVGQLLAFFRCLHEGLRPHIPSENGVIHRVVQAFTLHLPRA